MTRDKSGGSDGHLTCSTILFRPSLLSAFGVGEFIIFIPTSNTKCTGTNIYSLYPSFGPSVSLPLERCMSTVGLDGWIITTELIVTGLYPWEEYTQEGALPFTQH